MESPRKNLLHPRPVQSWTDLRSVKNELNASCDPNRIITIREKGSVVLHRLVLGSLSSGNSNSSINRSDSTPKREVGTQYDRQDFQILRPFQCEFCDWAFKRKEQLFQHLLIHTGLKPYQCPFCDFSSIHKHNVVKHQIIHTDEKPFACPQCDYSGAIRYYLIQHLRRKHGGQDPPRYTCQYCPFFFVTPQEMEQHRGIHQDDVPEMKHHQRIHQGDVREMDQHKRIHKDDVPEIKHHQRIHQDDVPGTNQYPRIHEDIGLIPEPVLEENFVDFPVIIKCRFCDFSSLSQIMVRDHEDLHRGEELECSLCPYTCVTPKALKAHQKKHQGWKSHKCGLCDHDQVNRKYKNKKIQGHSPGKSCKGRMSFSGKSPQIEEKFVGKIPKGHGHPESEMELPGEYWAQENSYNCGYCSFSSRSRGLMKLHEQEQHLGDPKPDGLTPTPNSEFFSRASPNENGKKLEDLQVPNVLQFITFQELPQTFSLVTEVPCECSEFEKCSSCHNVFILL